MRLQKCILGNYIIRNQIQMNLTQHIWKWKYVWYCIAENRKQTIWQAHNKINRNGRNKPQHRDNKTVESDIADVFAETYHNFYKSDGTYLERLKQSYELKSYDCDDHITLSDDVTKAISKLKVNKSDDDKVLLPIH